ncbi:MAG: type II secretion system protein M [Pseudomonadales bacterium]|nr:type II secretion system protein M [Pseudomonadales bacterium]
MKNWFITLSERDRKIVVILALTTSFLMLYTFLWMPLSKDNSQLDARIERTQTDLQWMQKSAAKIKAMGPAASKAISRPQSSDSFLTLIERTATRSAIKLEKIIPKKDQQVELRLKDVSFNQAIRWIELLKRQHGIITSKFSSEKLTSGKVNLVIVLEG